MKKNNLRFVTLKDIEDDLNFWKVLSVINSVDPLNLLPNDNILEYINEAYFIKEILIDENINFDNVKVKIQKIFIESFDKKITKLTLERIAYQLQFLNLVKM